MNYPVLPTLNWDGTIWHDSTMGVDAALLPTGGYPTAHAPALLELPNGDLLCAWFAGSYEGSADIHIICSRLPKGAGQWEAPVEVSGDPERSEQNPSLFYGPDQAVWAIYTAQLDRQPGKDNMQFTSQIRCQKSTDGGKTWGEYFKLPKSVMSGVVQGVNAESLEGSSAQRKMADAKHSELNYRMPLFQNVGLDDTLIAAWPVTEETDDERVKTINRWMEINHISNGGITLDAANVTGLAADENFFEDEGQRFFHQRWHSNDEGNPVLLELVAAKRMPHAISPAQIEYAWRFMKQFSRESDGSLSFAE